MKYDVVIVGGGHSGIEAVWAASQFSNLKICLITMPNVPIASAPCNPAVGGVGKGQVVREIDAMGGAMGLLADQSGIQFRMLNESRGYAVQSTRVQIDKELYAQNARKLLATRKNIFIIEDKVERIDISQSGSFTVYCQNDVVDSFKIVITTGTFLNGVMHTGSNVTSGGRVNCQSSAALENLLGREFCLNKRFKTGTPPRILASSIDFSKMQEQPSDIKVQNFHYAHAEERRIAKQVSCFLTNTNEKTLKIIRDNKLRSPMYNGQIHGIGPRYCPSIEDKAYRYPDKNIHHVFIEPEGLELDTFYPNGISTSLPLDVQADFLRTIEGLEESIIKIPGYAVEYDVVDTSKLSRTLEHKEVVGLYFAGQINGTSGYEEAAGQGLVAGLNAALAASGSQGIVFDRYDSYIGVMVEDLVTGLRDEPYRLFTARSENRLAIREDNTFARMRKYYLSLGIVGDLTNFYNKLQNEVSVLENLLNKGHIKTEICQTLGNPVDFLNDLLVRSGLAFSHHSVRQVAIEARYEGYIQKSNVYFDKIKKMDKSKLNFNELLENENISFECRQRISAAKPATFGDLRRIGGIRQATLYSVAAKIG